MGAILCGIIVDKMGRKPTIIFSDMLLILGPALLWGATTVKFLLVGRVIIGLGIGVSIMASTIFLAESSPTKVRGAMISCYHIMAAIGVVISFATALLFDIRTTKVNVRISNYSSYSLVAHHKPLFQRLSSVPLINRRRYRS